MHGELLLGFYMSIPAWDKNLIISARIPSSLVWQIEFRLLLKFDLFMDHPYLGFYNSNWLVCSTCRSSYTKSASVGFRHV